MEPSSRRFPALRLLLSVSLLGVLAGALAFGLRDQKAPTQVIAIADETAGEFDTVSIPERYPIALGSVGSARVAGAPPLQYPFLRGSTVPPDFRPFSESASSAGAGLKAATAKALWWHVCNRLPQS